MPTIQFQNDGRDGLRVLSTMYFPTDETKRSQLLLDFADQDDATLPLAPRTQDVVPADNHMWAMAVSDAGWRGTVAGEALRRLALLVDDGAPEPSMRKVVASLQQHAIELRTDPSTLSLSDEREDRSIAITERSIWGYLRAFKSVCHLWAAHCVLEREFPFHVIPEVLRDERQLAQFLAHADWFLTFGTSQVTRNDKAGALLDRSKAWAPPHVLQGVKPDLGDCPSSLVAAVQGYRAH